MLESRARNQPGHAALVDANGRSLSYSDLERCANRLASSLAAAGLRRGDRAVVLVPVSRELYLSLVAILKLGATAVFVEPALGLAELVRCCELAEPRAFIGVPRAHLLRVRSRVLRDVPIAVVAGRGPIPGTPSLGALLRREAPIVPTAAMDDGTPALLTYTSGTTGTPKAIARTHALLAAQHRALLDAFPVRATDRGYSAAPLFALHDLAAGATAVLPPRVGRTGGRSNVARLVDALVARRVTLLRLNPRLCESIAERCERIGAALPDVRALFVGGAPVDARLLERLRAILPLGETYVAYGSSEAEPIAALPAAEFLADAASLTAIGRGYCVGACVASTGLRVDATTDGTLFPSPAPVPAPAVGEIIVAGPHVNAAGWHRTGDTGYVDARGRLWLLGRESDRVRRAGRVLHPYAVEPVIGALPFVERCALVGMRDASLGERSVLVVAPRASGPRAWLARRRWRAEIERLCAARGIPVDEIRWMAALPLDRRHRSKIRHEELRRRLSPNGAAR